MFERYTEAARRSIFFARYEASQLGGRQIETEHLLLGLLRENKATVHRFLTSVAVPEIRAKIEAHSTRDPKLATSVDLPLSEESRRVLAYAAEEAERLAQRHIGGEHLLLGLLREESGYAALLLGEHGIHLAALRLEMAKSVLAQNAPDAGEDTLLIHGAVWQASYVRDMAEQLKKSYWQEQRWGPIDIVVHRQDGLVSFDLTLGGDDSQFELRKRHWADDKCVICHWEFSESGEGEHTMGYSNGREWLCSECYKRFLALPGESER
jgi:ATP-dependent Clp protease ATP-binding subunit ClpA